jgi:phage head maturation protease
MVAFAPLVRIEDRIAKRHGFESEEIGLKATVAEMEVRGAGENRIVTSIINTDSVDMENEVIMPTGIDTTYFIGADGKSGTRSVFWNHDYDLIPVASCRTLRLVNGALVAQAAMSRHPFAVDLTIAIEDGAVRGTSVGVRRLTWGPATSDERKQYGPGVEMVTRSSVLLEYSFTGIPANGDALNQLVTVGKIARKSASYMGAPDVTPERKSWPTTGPATPSDQAPKTPKRVVWCRF